LTPKHYLSVQEMLDAGKARTAGAPAKRMKVGKAYITRTLGQLDVCGEGFPVQALGMCDLLAACRKRLRKVSTGKVSPHASCGSR